MAYTSVKAIFEIGHEANLRSKKTKEGFTHDWDLFIRGADNTEIYHFVEKVAFHLHDSFPIPKRVVKEPPFSIHESGYASFQPMIEVYLKNKPPEPNKISFMYDLTLPGPGVSSCSNLTREPQVFNNPSEDFRRKLIRGGGVGTANSTSHSSHMASLNSSHSVDDHKTSGSKNRPSPPDTSKKSKKDTSLKHEERLNQNDPFSIFGAPIFKKEIPYTTTSKSNSKPVPDKASLTSDKQQAHSSKTSKHTNSSSHKDKDRDKEKEREKEKEKPKEREKEKSAATAVKRRSKDGESVVPLKKTKTDGKDKASTKSSKEDLKMKSAYHEEKQKEKEKTVEKPVTAAAIVTAEKEVAKLDGKKEKDKKQHKAEKLKSKDKHKTDKKEESYGGERNEKATASSNKEDVLVLAKEERKTYKADDKEEKSASLKDSKSSGYSNEGTSAAIIASQSAVASSVFDAAATSKKDDKHKHHKHKKEKSKKESKRDKEEKKEKIKESSKVESKERTTPVQQQQQQSEPPPKSVPKQTESPKTRKPLETLFDEFSDKSDSDMSSDDDMTVPQTLRRESTESSPEPPPPQQQPLTIVKTEQMMYSRPSSESAKDEGSANKRKSKKSSEEKTELKKRKRKSKHRDESPIPIKLEKYDSPLKHNGLTDPETKFTEAYITKLKVLQEKIMTLEDNHELQRVVQVVAETGQYEITTKTFDFDLCSLDEKIIDKLLTSFKK